MKKLLFFAGIAIFVASCTSVRNVYVVTPAKINFPKDVKSMLVVNNMAYAKTKEFNVIEGVLTGEQVGLDKKAGNSCVESLSHSINESNLFTSKVMNPVLFRDASGAIKWSVLDSVCDKEKSQVIICLDDFDSNSLLGAGAVLSSGANRVDGTATISIYHPKTQWKKEKIKVVGTHIFQSSGSLHPLDVLIDVTHKQDVVIALGKSLGANASGEVVPTTINVPRVYYKNGSKALRQSKRLIWYANWDIAEERFDKLSKEGSRKQRARATYNLALVKEVKGDLNKALELANICASEYNLKPSYNYINILKNRLADQEPLNYQLGKSQD